MASTIKVEPVDEWNTQLVENVHPSSWQNPTPAGRYNLVVVGAGTGGLITALIASSLGARVALIERHLMGGDCLNVGCVPSKAVIRGAQLVHDAREAARFGMPATESDLGDFGEVMRRMREIRARISEEDSAERYSSEFGIDIYLGEARFTGDGKVDVDGQTLDIAGLSLDVLHTPGHTPGHCCFYLEDEGVLFSGDQLFQGSIGRTDLPGGSYDTLMESMATRVLPLPVETSVLPGHGPTTTLAAERMHNPFLQELL